MVYPNPVVETLYIQLQPNDILTSVTLHTIKGQKILESTTNTLDLSSLTNGVYFLTILTNNGSSTKKIIK
jgi:aminopeptidase YwaD